VKSPIIANTFKATAIFAIALLRFEHLDREMFGFLRCKQFLI
jgi:hypothetical protein